MPTIYNMAGPVSIYFVTTKGPVTIWTGGLNLYIPSNLIWNWTRNHKYGHEKTVSQLPKSPPGVTTSCTYVFVLGVRHLSAMAFRAVSSTLVPWSGSLLKTYTTESMIIADTVELKNDFFKSVWYSDVLFYFPPSIIWTKYVYIYYLLSAQIIILMFTSLMHSNAGNLQWMHPVIIDFVTEVRIHLEMIAIAFVLS